MTTDRDPACEGAALLMEAALNAPGGAVCVEHRNQAGAPVRVAVAVVGSLAADFLRVYEEWAASTGASDKAPARDTPMPASPSRLDWEPAAAGER